MARALKIRGWWVGPLIPECKGRNEINHNLLTFPRFFVPASFLANDHHLLLARGDRLRT
jgi:hypothetical protein